MTKKEFLLDLDKSRKANLPALSKIVKENYTEEDNELAWRLFQAFPCGWTDFQRFNGMCLLITHMTMYTYFSLLAGLDIDSVVRELYHNLVLELYFHIAPKYLRIFVEDVQRTILSAKLT